MRASNLFSLPELGVYNLSNKNRSRLWDFEVHEIWNLTRIIWNTSNRCANLFKVDILGRLDTYRSILIPPLPSQGRSRREVPHRCKSASRSARACRRRSGSSSSRHTRRATLSWGAWRPTTTPWRRSRSCRGRTGAEASPSSRRARHLFFFFQNSDERK